MKKIFALTLALLLLCACSSEPSAEISIPSSLDSFGYYLDLSVLPKTMQQDVGIRSEEDMFISDCDSFTSLDFLIYGPLDAQVQTAMLLQAVPANTTQLQIHSKLIDIRVWDKYIVFKNRDIIVFDVFPLVFENSLSLPKQARQECEEASAKLTAKLDEMLSDHVTDSAEYRDISLALSATSKTRYLEYLWEYCHNNIDKLVKKAN